MSEPVCVIIGVGPGTGAAVAERFSEAGYRVVLGARNEEQLAEIALGLESAVVRPVDASDPAALATMLESVEAELGRIDILVYNASGGGFKNLDDATVEDLETGWRVTALGLFAAAKAVTPGMQARGAGCIIVTGATASLRGGPNALPFAQAKAAQRSIAESLARQLGPQGIHVALVVIDGVINLKRTREAMPDKPDSFFLKPAEIAETYFRIATQGRSAWSFLVDLRPFGEKF